MNPVSPEFLTAIRGPHQMVRQVDLLQNGQVVMSNLNVTDGSVDLDVDQPATCQLTVVEPVRLAGLASPYGYELAIRRGVTGHRPEGAELCPLAVCKITDYRRTSTGALEFSGIDRMKFLIDAAIEDDLIVVVDTPAMDLATLLVGDSVPWARVSLPATAHLLPESVYEVKTPRSEILAEIGSVVGRVFRFNGDGALTAFTPPPLGTPAVWTADNGPGGVVQEASQSGTDANIVNRVIAASPPDDTGVVFSSVATDETSPTRYAGPFGKKPEWIESDLFTSDDMCVDAAQARLDGQRGEATATDFSAVPNCALTPGDVVMFSNTSLGINAAHVIQHLTIGLTHADAMSGTTRALA